MKINAVTNAVNFFSKSVSQKSKNPSFKSIYLDNRICIGEASIDKYKSKFLKSDALLLNKISQLYPNQDCFIKSGYAGYPCLEYREKPPEVQPFDATIYRRYEVSINPDDKDYPTEPMLLYDTNELNRIIGMPSFISLNPSLAYTVQAGYELHKRLIEKKIKIMEVVGKTDGVILGEKTLIQRAHEGIKETEEAVRRYLLESAYLALSKRASAKQLYESNYPKVQSRLDTERTLDLTTSYAKQQEIKRQIEQNLKNPQEVDIEKMDICDYAEHLYPNYNENIDANKLLMQYMLANGLIIA